MSRGGLATEIEEHARQVEADALRLAQLLEEVTVRIRFGLAAFNAASMVALASAAGAAPAFLASAGILPREALMGALFFAGGTISAGIAIFETQRELITRAGFTNARGITLRNKAGAVKLSDSAAFEEHIRRDEDLFAETLKRSATATLAQHASGTLWAAGVAMLGWSATWG